MDAISGNHKAINSMLKIMERRAKLLGLDGPIKIAPTDLTGTKEYDENSVEVSEIIAKLTALVEKEEDSEYFQNNEENVVMQI